jgi:hypothetical protein
MTVDSICSIILLCCTGCENIALNSSRNVVITLMHAVVIADYLTVGSLSLLLGCI